MTDFLDELVRVPLCVVTYPQISCCVRKLTPGIGTQFGLSPSPTKSSSRRAPQQVREGDWRSHSHGISSQQGRRVPVEGLEALLAMGFPRSVAEEAWRNTSRRGGDTAAAVRFFDRLRSRYTSSWREESAGAGADSVSGGIPEGLFFFFAVFPVPWLLL